MNLIIAKWHHPVSSNNQNKSQFEKIYHGIKEVIIDCEAIFGYHAFQAISAAKYQQLHKLLPTEIKHFTSNHYIAVYKQLSKDMPSYQTPDYINVFKSHFNKQLNRLLTNMRFEEKIILLSKSTNGSIITPQLLYAFVYLCIDCLYRRWLPKSSPIGTRSDAEIIHDYFNVRFGLFGIISTPMPQFGDKIPQLNIAMAVQQLIARIPDANKIKPIITLRLKKLKGYTKNYINSHITKMSPDEQFFISDMYIHNNIDHIDPQRTYSTAFIKCSMTLQLTKAYEQLYITLLAR